MEKAKKKRGRPQGMLGSETISRIEREVAGDATYTAKTLRGKQEESYADRAFSALTNSQDGESKFPWVLKKRTVLSALGRFSPQDRLTLAQRIEAMSPRPTAKAAVAWIRAIVAKPDGTARGLPASSQEKLTGVLLGSAADYINTHSTMSREDVKAAFLAACHAVLIQFTER